MRTVVIGGLLGVVLAVASGSSVTAQYKPEQGDAISATGVLQGCEKQSDLDYCTVIADTGEVYSVVLGDRATEDVQDALLSAPTGSRVTVEGNIIDINGPSVAMTGYSVSVSKPESGSTNEFQPKFIGLWRSIDDAQSTIRFENNAVYDYYSGDLVGQGTYSFPDTCADSAEDGGAPILLRTDTDGTEFCYEISSIDGSKLELIYLPRGNVLTYEKLDPSGQAQ